MILPPDDFTPDGLGLVNRPWAILPSALTRLSQQLSFHCRDGSGGRRQATSPVPAAATPRADRGPTVQFAGRGTVGVLPLFGPLMQRDCLYTMLSGGTGLESWCAALRQLAGSPAIKSICLVVDSPGGSVWGVTEAAAEVRQAAKQKRVVAAVSSIAASAAYWVISGSSDIAVTPSGQVGSIGVFAVHEDHSEELRKAGVAVTTLASSPYKAEGDESRPLTPEAKAYLQKTVNAMGDVFISDVAKGRNLTEAKVRGGFGQGRMVLAQDAVKAGMADRLATVQDVMNGLASGSPAGGRHLPAAVAARLARVRDEM